MSTTKGLLSVLGIIALLAPLSLSTGCGASAKPDPSSPKVAARSVTGTSQLPASTAISVTIDVPPDGTLIASPPGAVTLQGTASVGAGAAAPAKIVFALDVSQATDLTSQGTCDPGATGISTILGCEIAAALKTNSQADPSKVLSGVVIFGGGGQPPDVSTSSADMSSASGENQFAQPGTDVATVLSSITKGNVAQFTPHAVSSLSPSFGAGLQAAGALAGTGPAKTIVFLSNGANGAGPAVSSATFPSGVVVRAFALGDHGCAVDASGSGSLADVAARGAPGSTCQRLATLADLPDVTVAENTRLIALTVTVDDGVAIDISATSTPALPQDGPADVQYSYLVEGLQPGVHKLCAQAKGVDSGGEGSVQACVTVKVASITLAPAQHVSELGTPGQTHTVVATVAAGAAGGVAAIPVSFNITKGPNVGGMATATTDANGQASYTYTARQHLAGLGTDLIAACFTDGQGTDVCAEATQTWQDTTPPVPSCPPGPNPGGNVPGSAGNGGQNPSGFYMLVAVDAVDPDPQVFLRDAGSGTVFGPFKSGTAVKYTQAPGASPDKKTMAGAVAWHITGKGDANIHARDAVGNVSAAVSCLVPPKPK